MKLIKERRENAAILTLKGDFDSFVCNPFLEVVNDLLQTGIKYLILDLRLILFINSTAVGALVKLNKEARSRGAELVLCRPSNFVRDALDTLGLKRVFRFSDDPEKALEELGASDEGMEVGGDNSVILQPFGGGNEKLIGKNVILESGYMVVRVPEVRDDLAPGSECRVKFRIPLFRKGYYFSAVLEIQEASTSDEGVDLKLSLRNMNAEDRESISRFVKEMKFLRTEAHGN